jgi:hypothetical protein
MNKLEQLAVALLLAVISLSTAQAATPTGIVVKAQAFGMVSGGNNIALTWDAPTVADYKVWLQVPKGSTAINALYRVYPNGNSVGNTVCSSTDATYPCFEIAVNQALNQNKWVQLTSSTTAQWSFSKNGYVVVNPANLATTELLGIATVKFEKISSTPTTLAIGKTYQGGIIFYLDGTGKHGLIAAPTDQSTGIQWNSNGSYTTAGATGISVGTGKANTAAIMKNQGAGDYAAKLCDSLVIGVYKDWFLPSKEELALMYRNIGQGAAAPLTNVGSFASLKYWSSSENGGLAWIQGFDYGNQNTYYKDFTFYVRAVRAF